MSYINPTIPTITLKGLDSKIQDIQASLATDLSWLEKSFGLADRIVEQKDGRNYIYPAVFESNVKDPIPMLPGDSWGAFSFWVKNGPASIEGGESRPNKNPIITYNVSCIFYVDIRRIDNATNYKQTKSDLIEDIFNFFNRLHFKGQIVLTRFIDDDIAKIWDGYSLEGLDQFIIYPKWACRLDFEVSYRENYCIPAAAPITPSSLVTSIVIPNTLSTIENSVVHPSVVYFEDGWHNYKYWMVATPFPGDSSEEPSIFVSNDAITWGEPTGLTNPVFSYAIYGQMMDTHLVYDASLDKLVMYFTKSSTPWGIQRSQSSDGVTWSALTAVTPVGMGGKSPTVVVKSDGSYEMWSTDTDATLTVRMHLYHSNSADGITWDEATECTVPEPISVWHMDIHIIGGVYYMLANTTYGSRTSPTELYWLSSVDGLTWVDVYSYPVIDNRLTYALNYRSCFIGTSLTELTMFVSEWTDYSSAFAMSLYKDISIPYPSSRPNTALSLVPTLPYIAGDNFTRADSPTALGVSSSGHTWVNLNTTLGISGNRAYRSTTNFGTAYIETGVSDNIIIEARFTTNPITGTGWCAIMFRATDTLHYWLWSILTSGVSSFASATLHKKNGGAAAVALTTGVYIKNGDILGVKLIGDTMHLMRNNVIIAEFTDALNNTATKHGIWIYNQTAGQSSYCDLFTVRNI